VKKFILDITREAGKSTLKHFRKAKVKSFKANSLDVLTQADLNANKIIIHGIKKNFPDHGIISEETGNYHDNAEYLWIIDPIDGTLNFARGLPLYVTMVALAQNGKIIMSAIYDPVHDQMYFAEKGKGALLNGKRITCSKHKNISGSVSYIAGIRELVKISFYKKLAQSMESDLYTLTSAYNSTGFGGPHIADGKKDWMVSLIGEIWDYAALYLILKESGCAVTNIKGEPWCLSDKTMVAANPALHKKIIKCFS
jgi:myo-inositol-1(or 4)-monophosphatase